MRDGAPRISPHIDASTFAARGSTNCRSSSTCCAGEISVVGPRLHALEYDDLYQTIVDGYINRYRVKPGTPAGRRSYVTENGHWGPPNLNGRTVEYEVQFRLAAAASLRLVHH
ncbi:hypothetical protein WL77_23225 [Burkholderia ubonensis]|nr:hypothetical protein WL77_23225 [Burkholderia ubonensis]KWE78787.1 hypothetical protein WL79_05255 [Burkholderia ubonensis]